jgi:GNAT superfamily N-acetyltransferase
MPTPIFTIRSATADDADLLAALGAQTFHDSYTGLMDPARLAEYVAAHFNAETQAAELADPDWHFLIVEAYDEAIGYANLRDTTPPDAITGDRPIELGRIYLREDWKGRGVGAALMLVCGDRARSAAYDTIWLSVWEHNEQALAFYTKMGFVQVGTVDFQFMDELQTDFVLQRDVESDPESNR